MVLCFHLRSSLFFLILVFFFCSFLLLPGNVTVSVRKMGVCHDCKGSCFDRHSSSVTNIII